MREENTYTNTSIAVRLWLTTATVFTVGAFIYFLLYGEMQVAVTFLTLGFVIACAGSLPAYCVLLFVLIYISQADSCIKQKFIKLIITCLLVTLGYAFIPAYSNLYSYDNRYNWLQFVQTLYTISGVLFAASIAAIYLNRKAINSYFSVLLVNYSSPPCSPSGHS